MQKICCVREFFEFLQNLFLFLHREGIGVVQVNENLFWEKAFAFVRVQTDTLKLSKLLEKHSSSRGVVPCRVPDKCHQFPSVLSLYLSHLPWLCETGWFASNDHGEQSPWQCQRRWVFLGCWQSADPNWSYVAVVCHQKTLIYLNIW